MTMPVVESLDELRDICRRMRGEIVKMIGEAGSGHPGGSLSAVEMLVALYFRALRHDPQNPNWADRDRFVLSKGHGCPVLYAAYAEAGYLDPALLHTLRKHTGDVTGAFQRALDRLAEDSTGDLYKLLFRSDSS